MSTYNLSQTAAEIDSAIGKVHNADTAPTEGSTSMVTSGGVYTAVNSIGISALPITTQADGIANYDNDSNVPTNAAVKDYVDSSSSVVSNLIVATAPNQSGSSDFIITGYTLTGSNVTQSSGVLTITGSGIWAVSVNGRISISNNGRNWSSYLSVNNARRINGSEADTESSEQALSGLTFVASSGSFTVRVHMDEIVRQGSASMYDLRIEAIKLT